MGLFGISEDHEEQALSLDERYLKNSHSKFFFKMQGPAMSPEIMDGDLLLIDRSLKAQKDDMVVASVNGEFLVRYFSHTALGSPVLRAVDTKVRPKILMENEVWEIFGVVSLILREKAGRRG